MFQVNFKCWGENKDVIYVAKYKFLMDATKNASHKGLKGDGGIH